MKARAASHVDARGAARMVDVADKPETARTATASAAVKMKRETLRLVERASGARGKGDVLAVARLAGIMAARRTAELIPLCHPIRLTSCEVDLDGRPRAAGGADPRDGARRRPHRRRDGGAWWPPPRPR